MLRRQLHTTARVLEESAAKTVAKSSLDLSSKRLNEYFYNTEAVVSKELKPPSFKTKYFANQYKSPLKLHETFEVCNEYLSKKGSGKTADDSKASAPGSIARDYYNPNVRYNFQYHNRVENNAALIDYNLPVYRKLNLEHWQESMDGKGQMLLMQRLESLNVIPDTLPTLEAPKYQLMVRFPFVNGMKRWVEPGVQLSSNATSFPPQFKVINMVEDVETKELLNKKFTILVVNPDEPCLNTDSYKTVLHYALSDITFKDLNDNLVSEFTSGAQDKTTTTTSSTCRTLADYIPPVPEKNTGLQRFAVWLLEQEGGAPLPTTSISNESRMNFDIRSFVAENNLEAVSANVWRSAFDTNVPALRTKYNLPKGRVFHKVRV